MFQQHKLYAHLVIWNIFFALICIPTAGKMVDIAGIPLSISVFFFPFVYIVSDILTEVYGYAAARRALWYTLATQIAAVVIFQAVAYAPPSATFTQDESFRTILSAAPQLVAFGMLAVFLGDITNNYVLAKMKVWNNGKYMPARLVVSTAFGQLINTAIFYIFGLWGFLPTDKLIESILVASVIKTLVEIVMLPATMYVVNTVKKIEGVDYFDKDTDFNPLKL